MSTYTSTSCTYIIHPQYIRASTHSPQGEEAVRRLVGAGAEEARLCRRGVEGVEEVRHPAAEEEAAAVAVLRPVSKRERGGEEK